MNLLTLVTVDVYPFLKPYPYKPYHYQQVKNCLNACLMHILSHLPILIDSVVILFPGFLDVSLHKSTTTLSMFITDLFPYISKFISLLFS